MKTKCLWMHFAASLTLITTPLSGIAAPLSESAAIMEEVIVTARRRAEDIAQVPTTMTALSGEALKRRSIVDQSDLQAAVPGLIVRESHSNNQLNYAIRGQTVDAFSASSTAVVPYVNEVPFIAGAASSFYDLESIQVLKGPQGTLFGRNGTGGAVLSTTAKPTDELSGYIKGGFGNHDAKTASGAINIPIFEDTLLFRGAFDFIKRDGYIDNLYAGDFFNDIESFEMGEVDRNSFRGSLLARPTDSIENLTVYQYGRAKGNSSGSQPYSFYRVGETQPDGTPLNTAGGFLLNPGLVDATFGPGTWDAYLALHPGAHPDGLEGAFRDQREAFGFWEVSDQAPSYHRSKDWFFTNTTTVEVSPNMTVKNIFGYSDSRATESVGQLGLPVLLISTYNIDTGRLGNRVNNKSLTEELQLQGVAFNQGLDYILGVYYQELENRTSFPQTFFDLSPMNPPGTGEPKWKSDTTSKAVYAHGTFDLGILGGFEGLKLSMGGRYTWEKVSLDHLPGGTFFGLATESIKFDEPSWNVGLEYYGFEDLMLYLQVRESWRAGGINGVAPPNLPPFTNTDKFDSEVAQDIEVGMKYTGTVADRPARFFLSAYFMEVENIQRVLYPSFEGRVVAVTVNVPEAEIKGFELETSIQATDWLTVGLAGAYTDAKYTDNEVVVFGDLQFNFGPFADTPEWTGSLYATVTLPVSPELGTMMLRGDVYAQSKMYFSNTNDTITPRTNLPSYELVNLRLDWEDIMGSAFSLGAYVKNATEEEYYVGGLPLGASMGVNSAIVGRPRMYGIDLQYNF